MSATWRPKCDLANTVFLVSVGESSLHTAYDVISESTRARRSEWRVMRASDMLDVMKAENRQKLAGRVVRDEIARQRKTVDQAARDSRMAPSTLYRILNGVADKDSSKYRALEGALGFPDDLLRHVIEGNADRIEAIRPENIRSSLRDSILYELVTIDAELVEDEDQQQAQ